MSTPVLEVIDLAVSFDGGVAALRGVDLQLAAGETLAVVGESGAGKSTLALSLAGLVQPPAAGGSVRVCGEEVIGASQDLLRTVRWEKVALTLQGAPFNPVMRVGAQIEEPMVVHAGVRRRAARDRATTAAEEMLLDPALLERYPHQLSGGQRCRASLAMAIVLDPAVLVLDEPTQGLDSATALDVVEAIAACAARRGVALVVVTHDLGVAARLTSRTVVLYAGKVVEDGETRPLLNAPMHPYTSALVATFPVMTTTRDLRPIRGRPADARAVPGGCAYHPRCTQAVEVCEVAVPALESISGRRIACHLGGLRTLLAADGLHMRFGRKSDAVVALSDVAITLREGESVGVVGPSGSGKSTLARVISGHLTPDAGNVLLEGTPLVADGHRVAGDRRRSTQLVMQDPWDALSPRLSVADLVREPLDIDGGLAREERDERVALALESVGLPRSGAFLESHAHQLSGGQLQRVALARALIVQPKLLVADEPTSMLDPSEQARLLLTLRERQVEIGLGLILVSHDIALVRKVCDRIVVLEGGRVVEEGPANLVSASPQSVTGQRLVDAAPAFAPGSQRAAPARD